MFGKTAGEAGKGEGRTRRRRWRALAIVLAASVAALQILLAISVASHAQAISPQLPPEMAGYKYLFIVGSHHSGTSLFDLIMCSHPECSCLKNTSAPEDEGQHVQKVYPRGRATGGMNKFAFHDRSHITANSKLVTDENRMKLFKSWSQYWDNMDAQVLLEKSPPDVLKTNFLQEIFTRDRTRFVMMMRHPLGALHWRMTHMHNYLDCCRRSCHHLLRHWLVTQEVAAGDLENLEHVRFFKFEEFSEGDEANGRLYIHKLERFIGLSESEHVFFNSPDDDDTVTTHSRRRKPLEYHGSRKHVTINLSTGFNWIKLWKRVYAHDPEECDKFIDEFEESVLKWGYSLKMDNLMYNGRATRLEKYHLIRAGLPDPAR